MKYSLFKAQENRPDFQPKRPRNENVGMLWLFLVGFKYCVTFWFINVLKNNFRKDPDQKHKIKKITKRIINTLWNVIIVFAALFFALGYVSDYQIKVYFLSVWISYKHRKFLMKLKAWSLRSGFFIWPSIIKIVKITASVKSIYWNINRSQW